MKWLSNTYDPFRPNADMYVARSLHETHEQAVNNHRDWLKDKFIGEPKGTDFYSVAELRHMGYVGVYSQEVMPDFIIVVKSP